MFIGHTRFSLFQPGSGAWKASNRSRFKTASEYREHLFSPERLDVRVRIFFSMTLPQLQDAARSHDVRHIVSFSDSLPGKYQGLLREAAEMYPFLILDRCTTRQSPMRPVDVARKAVPDGEPLTFGVYRLDDDDALPSDYFDQVSPYLTENHAGMIVSLGTGITALYLEGELYNARRCYLPMLGLGLLSVCHLDEAGNVTEPAVVPHNRSDRANAVILDSRRIGYLWVRHVDQDTAVSARVTTRNKTLERVREHMNQYPSIEDEAEVRESFSRIADFIHSEPDPGLRAQHLISASAEIPNEGLRFTLDPISGRTRIVAKIVGDGATSARSALVAFDLVAADGEPLEPGAWREQLTALGVSISGNKRIGFYRYLTTRPGTWDTTFEVEWPEGVSLRGIDLVKWRHGDYSVAAEALEIDSVDDGSGNHYLHAETQPDDEPHRIPDAVTAAASATDLAWWQRLSPRRGKRADRRR